MASVLVVDDQIGSLESMKHYLEVIGGHDPVTADSGRAAEAIMSARRFDVLIFDFKIADVDGLSLSRWARGHGVTEPIILCSAIDPDDLKAVAARMTDEQLGPVAVMAKATNPPVTILELIAEMTDKVTTRNRP